MRGKGVGGLAYAGEAVRSTLGGSSLLRRREIGLARDLLGANHRMVVRKSGARVGQLRLASGVRRGKEDVPFHHPLGQGTVWHSPPPTRRILSAALT